MGGINEGLKALGASDKLVGVVKTAESIIGVIPAVGQVYSAVMLVFNLFGLFKSEDALEKQIKELESIVTQGFLEVLGDLEAVDISNRMQHIADHLGTAATQVVLIEESTSKPDDAECAELNRWSLDPISALGDLAAFWNRPFFGELDAAYKDNWNGTLYPPTSNILGPKKSVSVFDYRLILPAYLYVLSCRMMVASITNPKEETYKEEINGYADTLLGIHETIRDSIVGFRAPKPCEIWGDYTECEMAGGIPEENPKLATFYDLDKNQWSSMQCIIGAVDLYSGFATYDSYQDPRFYGAPPTGTMFSDLSPVWAPAVPYHFEPPLRSMSFGISSTICMDNDFYYENFLPKLAIRTLKYKRDVYVGIGLSSLWNIINRLRALAKKPQLDKTINWSYLSLFGAAWEINDLVMNMGGTGYPAMISMFDMALRLEMTDSISLRKMLEEC